MDDARPATASSPLAELRVGRQCDVPWDEMTSVHGASSARVRHCRHCDRDVFNISAMTRDGAEAFLTERTGERDCVRFYRRSDGTIVTSDCSMTPAQRRVLLRTLGASATFMAAVASTACTPDAAPHGREISPDPAQRPSTTIEAEAPETAPKADRPRDPHRPLASEYERIDEAGDHWTLAQGVGLRGPAWIRERDHHVEWIEPPTASSARKPRPTLPR